VFFLELNTGICFSSEESFPSPACTDVLYYGYLETLLQDKAAGTLSRELMV